MNARVRSAAFMPLFATSTAEGPANHEALIQQMQAAGMMAGAWMVEELVRNHKALEDKLEFIDDMNLGTVKGEAHELYVELGNLAKDISGLAADLSAARFGSEEVLDAAVNLAIEVAESLAGEVGILEDNAFSIYNTIDI